MQLNNRAGSQPLLPWAWWPPLFPPIMDGAQCHADTTHPEGEGTAFSLFFESCFFEKEEIFFMQLLSRPPPTFANVSHAWS